jgi:hypothetical protein
MSEKAGIKKHGNAAVDAMMAASAQLENMSVYEELDQARFPTSKNERPCVPLI